MKTSEAQRAAVKRYSEKMDEVKIRLPKGERDEWKRHAEQRQLSLAELVRRLVRTDMEGKK